MQVGSHHTLAAIEKMRGRVISESHRANIGAASMGRRHSEVTKAKMAESHRGIHAGSKNPMWSGGPDLARRAVSHRAYYRTHREACSARHRLNKYGLTPQAFNDLLASQGGVCASCKGSEWGGKYGVPTVDHDHTTGSVRGILCHWCNAAVGYVRDDPKRADSVARYLREHGK